VLGQFGVWRRENEWANDPESASEFEELGFTALWTGGTPPADLAVSGELLRRTRSMAVATSIVNVWTADAAEVSRSFHDLNTDRFTLGIGVGSAKYTAGYTRPFAKLRSYVDELDVPSDRILVGALGPQALRLAGERTAGAHPYMTPVAHTAAARALLPGRLLAPEVTVVVEEDSVRARALGREFVGFYLGLSSYVNNLQRHGFTAEDFADGGSDRLVDALVAWGTPEEVAGKLREHLAAGADHVAIQSLNGHHAELATALDLGGR